jgi:hypothetical protein
MYFIAQFSSIAIICITLLYLSSLFVSCLALADIVFSPLINLISSRCVYEPNMFLYHMNYLQTVAKLNEF